MEVNEQQITKPAGFWIRLAANIIDGLLLSIPYLILTLLFGVKLDLNNPSAIPTLDPASSISNIISILYMLILPPLWNGATVGKRLVGIRIARVDGSKVTVGTMALRSIVGPLVEIIPLGLGSLVSLFMIVFRKDKRSIHDFIAGTYVTYNK